MVKNVTGMNSCQLFFEILPIQQKFHQGEPAVVAWIVSASISHSVDVASWRSVVRIPLGSMHDTGL